MMSTHSDKQQGLLIDEPVFVVSLVNNAERSAHVRQVLAENPLNAELFPAVDATRIGKSEIENFVANGEITPNYLNELTPGELGCGMSHLYLWKTITDRKISMALVVEDDFVLCDEFDKKYKQLSSHVPQDFDVVFLYQFQRHRFPVIVDSMDDIIGIPTDPYGTVAYLVSLKGAEKLSRLIPPLRGGVDGAINELFKQGYLNVYASTENIIGDYNDFTSIVRTATYEGMAQNI